MWDQIKVHFNASAWHSWLCILQCSYGLQRSFYWKLIQWTMIKVTPPPPSFPLCFCSRWKLALVFAARFSCWTAALFIKREAACSKLFQIITICLQSPELSSKPALILPSNFLSQNWTCGSLCVTTSLPSPGRRSPFSQYFFSHFRRIIAVHEHFRNTVENIMP